MTPSPSRSMVVVLGATPCRRSGVGIQQEKTCWLQPKATGHADVVLAAIGNEDGREVQQRMSRVAHWRRERLAMADAGGAAAQGLARSYARRKRAVGRRGRLTMTRGRGGAVLGRTAREARPRRVQGGGDELAVPMAGAEAQRQPGLGQEAEHCRRVTMMATALSAASLV